MNEKCVLLKAMDFLPPNLPVAVQRGHNKRSMYNTESRILYRRDFWKIFYIFSGRGTLVINNKHYSFGPGFLCLIRPDDLTTFELDTDIDLSNILFRKREIADFLGELKDENDFFSIFDDDAPEHSSVIRDQLYLIDSDRRILALVKEMRREYLRDDQNSGLMLKLHLVELLIRMTRLSARNFSRKRRDVLAAYVLNRLEQNLNFAEPFDYQRAANELGITHFHLCNAYRKSCGETIGETLFRIRMKHAFRLLMETDKTVLEISSLCGFHDLSYFYRAFRKETGTSPGKFRRKYSLLT